MMNRFFATAVCTVVSLSVTAQERVNITSFEEDTALGLAYSGASIDLSFVDFSPIPPNDVQAQDGENALVVEYLATAQWNWSQLDFPAVDISGMREIHMWVFFDENWVGEPEIRIDLADGVGLGTQSTDGVLGEWVELVWTIDRFTSETLTDVSFFGGFIAPGDENASGTLLIDNIFALRPEGVAEVETVQLYGFNEEDPNTGNALRWQDRNGAGFVSDAVDPSEGEAFLELALGEGWTENVQTVNTLEDFDRWLDVVDVLVDARVSSDFTGTWVQFALVIQSGSDDVDGVWAQHPEQGFVGAVDEWQQIVWQVDMEQHRPALEQGTNPFLNVILISNNDPAVAGQLVFVDNFRVGVAVDDTNLEHWSLY